VAIYSPRIRLLGLFFAQKSHKKPHVSCIFPAFLALFSY